jgi:hypothetical protein
MSGITSRLTANREVITIKTEVFTNPARFHCFPSRFDHRGGRRTPIFEARIVIYGKIKTVVESVFCESSLLIKKPQYPTKGYAPHSGRGVFTTHTFNKQTTSNVPCFLLPHSQPRALRHTSLSVIRHKKSHKVRLSRRLNASASLGAHHPCTPPRPPRARRGAHGPPRSRARWASAVQWAAG